MLHHTAPRRVFRRSTSLLTIFLMVTFGLVGVPAVALTAEEECVPSDGTSAVFSAWTTNGFTEWQLDNTPVDPDGESGEDNPANLQMLGPVETREVGNDDATEGSYTEWTEDGAVITTEENVAPGADTDTVRYRFVGVTDPEEITPATDGQHYSLAGGSWKYPFAPGFPETGDPDGRIRWQPNTEQEPHTNGEGDPATWLGTVGVGLHYTSHGSSGNTDWFYYAPGTPAVTDVDYLWQKEVREWEPGQEETFDTEYRWPLMVRTYTPGEEPVECPVEPPVDDGDDNPSPGPGSDKNPPPVQVAGEQAAGGQAAVSPPAGQAQVPTAVAAGLVKSTPTQSNRAPVGLLLVVLGALLTAAALRRRARC